MIEKQIISGAKIPCPIGCKNDFCQFGMFFFLRPVLIALYPTGSFNFLYAKLFLPYITAKRKLFKTAL